MEGQFLVAQLAVLLEQRTAQHGLCRKTMPPGVLHRIAAQVPCHQADQGRRPCAMTSLSGKVSVRRFSAARA